MQYKYDYQGNKEELPLTVIDVGIGLERVPWLLNGSTTSYLDTFTRSLNYLKDSLEIDTENEIYKHFSPYSCMLDADEVSDLEVVWKQIAQKVNLTP